MKSFARREGTSFSEEALAIRASVAEFRQPFQSLALPTDESSTTSIVERSLRNNWGSHA